uniref:Deoxyribonuclease-1 n=1 Tax=Canis lupus familiaris TaxID=9615 RepID=A0A8C0YZT7_CANLF
MRGARLMGALLALAGLLQGALALRMAAFNIRTFGETKMSNATLSKYIVQASPGQPVPGEPQRWLWRWLKQVLGREGAAATDGGAAVPGMPSVAGSSPREELRARRGEGAPGNGSSSGAVGTSSKQGHHPRCPPSSAPLWPCPQILSRYDVAVVQEVRDSHLTAVGKLLDTLNQDDPNAYHYVVSEPLGRSSYKERYLFLFRPDRVSVLDSYQYDDGCEPCGNDTFSREPAIVRFHSPLTGAQPFPGPLESPGPPDPPPPPVLWSPTEVTQENAPRDCLMSPILGLSSTVSTEVKEFAVVPLHAAPLDAVAEIDALYDVYLDVQHKWDLEDIVLMGDFNAGCSYVAASQWSSIRLRTNPAFQWLIPDTADTTSTSTHCAYDRIVVAGSQLQHAVVPESAAPFNFQVAYGLSSQLAQAISDHYPVEVTLKRA